MNHNHPGIFTISLDFELFWGMRDCISLEEYKDNLLGVYQAIPKLLDLFAEYEIHATWATVGFLHFNNVETLKANLPKNLPSYQQENLSPYPYIQALEKEQDKQLLFCPKLIKLITQYPGQEIGTHTFSHYYCLETGQTEAEFKADMLAAIKIAKDTSIATKSLVFPRNQYNEKYLKILEDLEIICYRGNETHWMYNSYDNDGNSWYKRLLRLVDNYINISGHNCYSLAELKSTYPVNIPASKFLRPYSPQLKYFDFLRFQRIKSSLSYAAQHRLVYHLWWHPHNFGIHLTENLNFLSQIIVLYKKLHSQYEMRSLNMTELARLCILSN
jgi:peptidoglycan/xylan/chitin deacetylase (PgdA/CDA1 family)